jgi:hypothetical protein
MVSIQSFVVGIPPRKLLGKVTLTIIARLIEPTTRKPFTQQQAENFFGSKRSKLRSSDLAANGEKGSKASMDPARYRALLAKNGSRVLFATIEVQYVE